MDRVTKKKPRQSLPRFLQVFIYSDLIHRNSVFMMPFFHFLSKNQMFFIESFVPVRGVHRNSTFPTAYRSDTLESDPRRIL